MIEGFTEPCSKCRGRGERWIMADGVRTKFPCNTCKGLGTREFKESAERRAHVREKAKERKARKLEASIEDFQMFYPEIWEWMNTADSEFARSLRDAVVKWGSLTDKQHAVAARASTGGYRKARLI